MSQARDTVTEVTSDAVQQAKDTVREVVAGVSEQAKSTIHDVTADVVGQAKSTIHDVTGDVVGQAKTTVHAVVTDVADHAKETAKVAVSGAVSGAVGEAKEAVGSAVNTAKEAVGDAVDTAKGAGSTVLDVIKQNPLPASLIGLGLGWLYLNSRNKPRPVRYQEMRYPYESGYQPGGTSSGQTGREAGSRVGEVVDRAQEKAGRVVDKVQDTAGQVAGKVGDAVSTAKETAGDAVGTVIDTAKGTGSSLVDMIQRNPLPAALAGASLGWLFLSNQNQQHRPVEQWARDYGTSGRSRPTNYQPESDERRLLPSEQARLEEGYEAGEAGQYRAEVSRVSTQAQQQPKGMTDRIQQTLQKNPLPMGMVALGLGAAVGLLVPETEPENRVMGETRDKLAEKAQQTAEDLKIKAQIVVEESLDTAKQEARNQGLTAE
jgi:ElaB/YqjD/DUF883 family membrane-anchored ribosome-binding protein